MSYKIPPAWTFVRGNSAPRPQAPRPYEQSSLIGRLPPGTTAQGQYFMTLGQQPSALAPPSSLFKNKWMMILLAAAVIAALIWLLRSKGSGIRTIKRNSTSRLAKNLYRRLERNPKKNETLMRSLAQHARE